MRQKGRYFWCILIAVCFFSPVIAAETSTKPEKSSPKATFVLDFGPTNEIQGQYANTTNTHPSIFTSVYPPPERMTRRDKFYFYMDRTFGYSSILRSTATAGIGQARDSVPEWDQGMDGYSARLASSIGRRIINNTIHYGLGTLFHEDPRYYLSGRSGIWSRSLYAAGQTFVTHTDSGAPRFACEKVMGKFGGAFISRRWYPEERRAAGEYALSIAISFGFDAAKNIAHEFWPDIQRSLWK